MTKDRNNNKPRVRNSRIRASASRRSNEYYNALINTTLYDSQLGSKEAHEARHQARLSVVHSETTTAIRQEAIRDLQLHGQSLTNLRVATTIETFQPQETHYYVRNSHNNTCNCPTNWLICLYES